VDRYKISHPVIGELHDLAYQDMLAQMLIERLKGGLKTFDELSQDIDSRDVKKVLKVLVKKGFVKQIAESQFSFNDLP
jgi:ribosomal protein S8